MIRAMTALVLGITIGTSAMMAATHSDNVSSFNDGFTTSKQDDCQQGDIQACAWHHESNPCPTEDSCQPYYTHGAWHVRKVTP